MTHDPFRIEGPALIQFSGGRTSAFMLWRILGAHGGRLPTDVVVCFQNTGKEMPETLDFVRDCGARWSVPIAWLEYRPGGFAIVNHGLASRMGEPFAALIAAKSMLPNPVMRFCTAELKIRTSERYAATLGWEDYTTVIGLRADEPGRVGRMRVRDDDTIAPLATAGITKRHVASFWADMNWGLALPSVNGATPQGNCDLCFLKSSATISGIMRSRPDLAAWWIAQEARGDGRKPARFRNDRPSYATLLDVVERQGELVFADEPLTDCYCTGDA